MGSFPDIFSLSFCCGIPNFLASPEAPSTNQSAPFTSRVKPTMLGVQRLRAPQVFLEARNPAGRKTVGFFLCLFFAGATFYQQGKAHRQQ